jgi:3D (Asp-Asp-Asp) domain-containing protein/peptidoglycan hydrolase CwlO-like protein
MAQMCQLMPSGAASGVRSGAASGVRTSSCVTVRRVSGETRKTRVWPAAAALLVLCSLVPARVAADTSAPKLRDRASQLSQQNANLAARAHSALLELYALDSRLARERAHIVALRIETAQVRAEREAAQQRLKVARGTLTASQHMLSVRLQQLYEQGDTDPVAVVLGATTVNQALDGLDTLNRVEAQDKLVIRQTLEAQRAYRAQTQTLAARERQLNGLQKQASQTALALEQSRAQRASYIAGLTSQRRLNNAAISGLLDQASSIEAKARQISTVSRATGGGSPPGAAGTLTVSATGYSLKGRTATGAPVGWGVVAVDPNVIPLGTRMTIPGYGEGIAADTGSAIQGNTIDLWFPTLAQANAWGRRTVTITLH